jgi:hypothetical protein
MVGRPEFSDQNTMALAEALVPLREGPRVRVLRSKCQTCGVEEWIDGVVGGSWTVAAAVLRALATQWHTDDCPGPMQFETEPE